MLTILGFVMIATFLVLIMTKKMSPIAALVLIPALFCVLIGQGAKLGDYVIECARASTGSTPASPSPCSPR
ncbi:hypothetical protein GCM10011583_57390 [Streptomyces camponoticapitis]|uniref:Uncharacterized protein n=1 Tax=Streptomyces camponoticapitis TaxID=1616125 RepID=A0ABQ2ENN0_9ACTN|nr:hypothetical protein [Streptomyces camponoticapitis]GGK18004.1 hypothetical protein GCM10011583_57390 [Streptomyces camponoticapitis]